MMDALFSIVNMCINVAAVLNVLLILKVFFGAPLRIGRRILFVVSVSVFFVNVALAVCPVLTPYTALVIFLCMAVCIICLSTEHRITNVFLAIPAALMYVQWGTVLGLFERLVGLDRFAYHYMDIMWITPFNVLSDFLLLTLLLILYKKVNRELLAMRFSVGEGVVVTIVCILYPVIVQFFAYIEPNISHPLYKPFYLIGMLIVNAAIIFAVAHRKKEKYYRMVAERYKEQFQEEYDSFRDYKETNSDTIRFRHDFKNHMIVLRQMFDAGEYERAGQYLSKLAADEKTDKQTFLTGNEIVDMILKAKYPVMQEHSISFRMQGNLACFEFMEDVDCCILFSNLFDNALDANALYDGERYVELSVKKNRHILYLQMKNPCASGQAKKEDKLPHGIGLKNVSDIVKKYNGESEIERKEHTFTIKCCFAIE